jgi:hypothetical protein
MKTTKKTFKAIILGVALLGLSQTGLTSCKKNYDCHCTLIAGGEEETEIKAKNTSDAEADCKAKNGSVYKDCHLD